MSGPDPAGPVPAPAPDPQPEPAPAPAPAPVPMPQPIPSASDPKILLAKVVTLLSKVADIAWNDRGLAYKGGIHMALVALSMAISAIAIATMFGAAFTPAVVFIPLFLVFLTPDGRQYFKDNLDVLLFFCGKEPSEKHMQELIVRFNPGAYNRYLQLTGLPRLVHNAN